MLKYDTNTDCNFSFFFFYFLFKERNITKHIEEWLRFLGDNPAVAVGLTQPPLVFQFWNDVEELDETWNFGSALDIERLARENGTTALYQKSLLHFNGDAKPWLVDDTGASLATKDSSSIISQLWSHYAPSIDVDDLI